MPKPQFAYCQERAEAEAEQDLDYGRERMRWADYWNTGFKRSQMQSKPPCMPFKQTPRLITEVMKAEGCGTGEDSEGSETEG